MKFRNREEAGQILTPLLTRYAGGSDVIVLALPRGGVPVGFEVARSLGVPLDVYLVRKLGVPGQEELAMGAIATGGVVVINDAVTDSLGIPRSEIDRVAAEEGAELTRRERLYRGSSSAPELRDQTVILIDDGLATGATMRAAVQSVKVQRPQRIVVAVPTGAAETCARIAQEVDEVVCASTPEPFYAVGLWYEDFSQTTDAEVRELLARIANEGRR